MTCLLDLIVILGFFTTLWGLVTSNAIPDLAAESITLLSLLIGIPLRVACRLSGKLLSRIVRYGFTIVTPLISILGLALRYGYNLPGGWPIMLILLDLLFLQLVGIWLIVWGAFTPPDGLFWNILPLVGVFVFVMKLILEKFISPQLGGFFIVVLLLLHGGLKRLERNQEVRNAWKVGLTLAAVLLLLFTTGGREYASFIVAVILLYITFYFALRNILRTIVGGSARP
jgi:hypothetical protein